MADMTESVSQIVSSPAMHALADKVLMEKGM
jgi:hypothetical protein